MYKLFRNLFFWFNYFIIFHTHKKKCWIHGNFLLPVFDGFICFRRSYKWFDGFLKLSVSEFEWKCFEDCILRTNTGNFRKLVVIIRNWNTLVLISFLCILQIQVVPVCPNSTIWIMNVSLFHKIQIKFALNVNMCW